VDVFGFKEKGTRLTIALEDKPGMMLGVFEIFKKHNVNVISTISPSFMVEGKRIVATRIKTEEYEPIVKDLEQAGYPVLSVGRWQEVPRIKNILYATDLSENSAYAFYFAVDFAQKHNANIIILHVVEPVSPHARPYIEGIEAVKSEKDGMNEAVEEIKNRLQRFCTKVDSQLGSPCVELVSKTLVPLGNPTEEILNAADKEDCDLIILGTHGKGFLAHTFLGSVSSSVLQRARKPVFIIPLPSEKTNIDWDKI
jgi:nucleotide-binding universal stress UspA family protein